MMCQTDIKKQSDNQTGCNQTNRLDQLSLEDKVEQYNSDPNIRHTLHTRFNFGLYLLWCALSCPVRWEIITNTHFQFDLQTQLCLSLLKTLCFQILHMNVVTTMLLIMIEIMTPTVHLHLPQPETKGKYKRIKSSCAVTILQLLEMFRSFS